jgi:hypothetical protein
MEEKEITPTESLQIIGQMINTAKNKLADDGFYFIFWGWLILVCAMFHYITIKMGLEKGYWIWAVGPPLGGIISSIYGYREGKSKKVTTYVDTYLKYIWMGFLVGMVVTLLAMPWFGMKQTYFSLMVLYGMLAFVTGGLLEFRPLIVGGLLSFACAAVSVFVGTVDQFLCISAALLCAHIIPGHLLRSKFRSQHV